MKKEKLMMKRISALVCALAFLGGGIFMSCSDSDDDSDNPASGEKTAADESGPSSEPASDSAYDDSALSECTLWVVGDSTVCDYGDYILNKEAKITDATYFYPRFGYGMQLHNYLSGKVTVRNLALSGRSSKSFLSEENYKTLKDGIKAGDFLVVGFGHNDEKSDDADRFASASESTDTEGSFKYNLFNYYAKIAMDKGATPILCSPIVRYSDKDDFSGDKGHVVASGDYGQAVVDLGTEKNIQVVDLTSLTKELYTKLGHDSTKYFHAIASGSSQTEPNFASIDGTHINCYGAKVVSWLFAKTIKNSSCSLKAYIKTTEEPSKEKDLVINPNYKYVAYAAVDWTKYEPIERYTTKSEGWYGTAFGDLGGDATTDNSGYMAKEDTAGTFIVGTPKKKGKIQTSADGIALAFKPIPVSDNFTVTVKAKVSDQTTLAAADLATGGFGLMLRDDCYEPIKDASVGKGNYVAAGLYPKSASETYINFCRESTLLETSDDKISEIYAAGSEASFTIERTGQVVKVTTVYGGNTYKKTYTDFDFVAIDGDYMYVGMFATRGTVVEFTEVKYEKTGTSQGA